MDKETKMEVKRRNLDMAMSFQEPDKIPVGINCCGWAHAYAGTTFRDTYQDPQACAAAALKILDDVEVDFCYGFGAISPNPPVLNLLGNHDYVMHEDGCGIVHNQANEHYDGLEAYDEIAEDFQGFKERRMIRKYPTLALPKEEALVKLREVMKAQKNDISEL